MVQHFIDLYPTGRITYTQTSFLELTTAVEVHRVEFIGKVAMGLKRGSWGPLRYYQHHPALSFFNDSLQLVTLEPRRGIPAAFYSEYAQCLTQASADWRRYVPSWGGVSYVGQEQVAALLPRGRRASVYLPDYLAQEVVALCQRYQVAATSQEAERVYPRGLTVAPPVSLLLIGTNYVIARDFYISTLR